MYSAAHKAGVIHLKGFCACATFSTGRFAFACAGRINKARCGRETAGRRIYGKHLKTSCAMKGKVPRRLTEGETGG